MNKIVILILISPLLLMGKNYSIPDGWPTFKPELSPEEMFYEAQNVLFKASLLCQSHLDRPDYFSQLHHRYLNESANAGYPPSIEWRINRFFTDVVALRETITHTQVVLLEQQLRSYVRDHEMHARCVNFLNQIRASGRVIE